MRGVITNVVNGGYLEYLDSANQGIDQQFIHGGRGTLLALPLIARDYDDY